VAFKSVYGEENVTQITLSSEKSIYTMVKNENNKMMLNQGYLGKTKDGREEWYEARQIGTNMKKFKEDNENN